MIRFVDGFDHYVTADLTKKWTLGSGLYAVGAFGRFGSNGLRMNDSQSVQKVIGSAPSFVLAFAFRATTLAGPRYIASFYDGATRQVGLQLNANATLSLVVNGTVVATSSTTLSQGVYYFLEWKVTPSASCPADSNIVKVAGVQVINVPAATNMRTTAFSTADSIVIGPVTGGSGYTFDYDDLYVLDSNGATNNTFIGDMRVEVLWPSGAGAHTDFTIGGSAPAATNWQSVAEHSSDGDVSYVSSATPGAVDTYTFDDLSTTPTSVAAVQLNFLSRKDDAGTRLAAGLVRASGADYQAGTFGVSDAYGLNSAVYELNPATGVAWTPSEVNGLEAGVKLVS